MCRNERRKGNLQLKNEMYMLCIRGMVSSERSIFIYLVCTLFCLSRPVGRADAFVAVVEFEVFEA